jgi:hypothetical protein
MANNIKPDWEKILDDSVISGVNSRFKTDEAMTDYNVMKNTLRDIISTNGSLEEFYNDNKQNLMFGGGNNVIDSLYTSGSLVKALQTIDPEFEIPLTQETEYHNSVPSGSQGGGKRKTRDNRKSRKTKNARKMRNALKSRKRRNARKTRNVRKTRNAVKSRKI